LGVARGAEHPQPDIGASILRCKLETQPKIAEWICGIYGIRRSVYMFTPEGEILFIFQKGIRGAIE
jgi:hypothetical protein